MGFFDFLSSPAQDPTMVDERGGIKKAKRQTEAGLESGYMPVGSGQVQEAEVAPAKDAPKDVPTEGPLKVDGPQSFQDKRAKLSEEIIKTAADIQIESWMASMASKQDPRYSKPISPPDRAAVENQFRADPGRAAEIILKQYGGTHSLMRSAKVQRLNDLVSQYKKAERSPEGQDYRASLEPKVDDSQIQVIRGEIQQLQAEKAKLVELLPDAASELHASDIKNRMKVLEQAEKAKVSKLSNLESTFERQKFPGGKPVVSLESAPSAALVENPVSTYMDGLGVDRETLVDRVRESMKVVGVGVDKWDQQVDPRAGILRVMAALDPQGMLAGKIAQQLADARAQDAASGGGQEDQLTREASSRVMETEGRIRRKEDELRALYSQLAQSPFMSTWPGIILYVLVGMLTQNPAFAARLIGGVGNREAIDREIKGIQFDLRRLDDELGRRETSERMMKQEAARRLQRRDERGEDWQHQIGMRLMEHNLLIERNALKNNPETALMKKLSAEFQRASAMAAKFSKTKDDPLVPEPQRKSAESNFNFYIQKAAAIDAQLTEMGGDVLDDEEEIEE